MSDVTEILRCQFTSDHFDKCKLIYKSSTSQENKSIAYAMKKVELNPQIENKGVPKTQIARMLRSIDLGNLGIQICLSEELDNNYIGKINTKRSNHHS